MQFCVHRLQAVVQHRHALSLHLEGVRPRGRSNKTQGLRSQRKMPDPTITQERWYGL